MERSVSQVPMSDREKTNGHYLGRSDFQVKIRGHRIEVPEIEMALLDHEAIKEAVVVSQEDAERGTRLVAYLTLARHPAPSVSMLRRFLRVRLPEHMIPAVFVLLDKMPLTITGKIDRRALPAPNHGRPMLDVPLVSPRTPVEAELVQLWAEMLDVEHVGVDDDFFELGGDSLLAMRLLDRVRTTFRADLSLAALVTTLTVAGLARAIEHPGEKMLHPLLLPYKPDGTKPPFFCVHGRKFLAQYMDVDQPYYALHPHALDGKLAPETVETMAADYIQALQTRQVQGPYFLGGYSFGGTVAFEMAHQLQRQGQQVAFLALLDSRCPGITDDADARPESIFSRFKGMSYVLARRFCAMYLRSGRSLPLAMRLPYFLGISRRVARTYVPQPYLGALVILLAMDNPNDLSQGWGEMASQGLEIHRVPGDHHTMLIEPHVQHVATQLQQCISKAHLAMNQTERKAPTKDR
jgi:thioesterase domain-containing protein/aryl carrier-like protein